MKRWRSGALAVLLLVPSTARADDASDCIDANEKAIQQRGDHKLLEARVSNSRCAAPSCPADLRPICTDRAKKIDEAIPRIVFDVKDGSGQDLVGVTVTVDGAPASTDPTATELELDPGPHVFVFTSSGRTLERSFVLREGEKLRREAVVIGPVPEPVPASPPVTPVPSAPPASSDGSSLRTVGLVGGGVGVVGLAVGGVFGLMASSSWSTAQKECPSYAGCSPQAINDRNSAATFATVSTASFVAGAILLVGGATLFLVSPSKHRAAVGLQVTPGGLSVAGGF
jgi:hypothetical protein